MNFSPPGTLRNAKKKNVTVDHKLSHLTVGNAHPTVLQITLKKWPIFRRVGIAHRYRLISHQL